MTEHVGFLEQLPVRAVLDGELAAFGEDGKPDFERICERMLFRHDEIPLVFLAFDVLSVEGRTFDVSRIRSAGRSSRSYRSTGHSGRCRRRSTTARRCGRPSASTSSRASWRSG
jgi:hypothetical protein